MLHSWNRLIQQQANKKAELNLFKNAAGDIFHFYGGRGSAQAGMWHFEMKQPFSQLLVRGLAKNRQDVHEVDLQPVAGEASSVLPNSERFMEDKRFLWMEKSFLN